MTHPTLKKKCAAAGAPYVCGGVGMGLGRVQQQGPLSERKRTRKARACLSVQFQKQPRLNMELWCGVMVLCTVPPWHSQL